MKKYVKDLRINENDDIQDYQNFIRNEMGNTQQDLEQEDPELGEPGEMHEIRSNAMHSIIEYAFEHKIDDNKLLELMKELVNDVMQGYIDFKGGQIS